MDVFTVNRVGIREQTFRDQSALAFYQFPAFGTRLVRMSFALSRVVYPGPAALYTGEACHWWFGGEEGHVPGGHKRRHPNSGLEAFAINLKRDGYRLLAGADAENTGKPIGATFTPLSPRFKAIGSKLKRDWAMEQKNIFRPTGFHSL